ncbi:ANTAR domain-containing response regulator [Calderihabitans maritimus]|uniref:Stage 0 sporulation protein A homolog n=1 Tax=Calderihabitans maritimus TaxID=1246530 RepID=A0A1Z5HQD5_9FIRM|nr:response regulator [Calderihabitans maritimus]GAW91648.1 response regulator with putative antiterminator output domain [Calderihabitans maritimus]
MFGSRIVLADADPAFRKNLKEMLTKAGYIIVAEAGDGLSALKAIKSMHPDLAILDARLPVKDGLEVAKIIEEDRVAPVLLLTAYNHKDIVQQAKDSWVFAYLVKPVNEANLFPAIEIAIANYRRMLSLEREIHRLKETLETRKLVERAKGILMEVLDLSEAEAFKKIQKESMNKRTSMRQIAQSIIVAYEKGRVVRSKE